MKILVIFTGGTIGSTESGSYISTDGTKPYKLINMYRQRAGEFNNIDNNIIFDIKTPYQMLSENNTCDTLRMLHKCLKESCKDIYDGIIITHGTDTLAYTAAFTAYIMEGAGLPVVLVSADYVLEDKRSNGLDNFYYAVEFICREQKTGVFVSYRNAGDYPKIHFATRIIMHQAYSDDVYSICNSYYGYFDGDSFLYNSKNKTSFNNSKNRINPGSKTYPAFYNDTADIDCTNTRKMDAAPDKYMVIPDIPPGDAASGILVIHPYPGIKYTPPCDSIKAVLHYTYHSGTICSTAPGLVQFAEYTRSKGIPVFITGAGTRADYESVKCYKELGFHVLPAMSPEAAYIKLWLCIINNKKPGEIAGIMEKPAAGDIYEGQGD